MRWPGLVLLLFFSVRVMAQEYQHVLVFLNARPDKAVLSEAAQAALQKAHMNNIDRLVAEGKLVVTGPFDGGGGIFVFASGKVAEVKTWLASDPAVAASRWQVELFPVRFLKGNVCRASKPYEMLTYNFVRVNLINDIANYKMNQGGADIWQHLQFHDEVLLVGVFPQSDGGVIIYSGEKKDLWMDDNQEDMISLINKDLWVAKGSFCE